MNEGFDREFYRSRWQRVLPVGPCGVQPCVRPSRGSDLAAAGSVLRRLWAIVARLMPSALALWRRARTTWQFGNDVATSTRRHAFK
jgi:hypothetical protein